MPTSTAMMTTLIVRYSRRSLTTPRHCCKSFHNENPVQNNEKNLRKTFYKNEEVKKIRGYILTRYMDYVQNYEKVIEKKFPTALHLYRTFKVGMKEFYRDLVLYMKIIRVLNLTTNGLKSLTLHEIEIYHKMPRDMVKVAPVLVLSALPMTNYVIFPLAYFYPRQMLCSHFWTLQQRSEFQIYYLRQRLLNHRPTFRCMQAQLETLKQHRLYEDWAEILGLVGSGVQPNTDQIIQCKELFECGPYQIECLQGSHVKNLLRMHDLHNLHWFRRSRLREHAKLLRAMDRAIIREHGLRGLSQESLKSACFIRGLNPINMKHEDLIDWLDQWLEVSKEVDHNNLSLLLHCPILLGYNQPNNWLLIY